MLIIYKMGKPWLNLQSRVPFLFSTLSKQVESAGSPCTELCVTCEITTSVDNYVLFN